MIIAKEPSPLCFLEPGASELEKSRNREIIEEFRKNVAWFGDHSDELRNSFAGMYICIAAQELFYGDDSADVDRRAKAAHPEVFAGSFSIRVSLKRGPRIYAH